MSHNNEKYIDLTLRTLYEAYFQELASGALVNRWEFINIVTAFVVAITASGSAIAGWAFWNESGWKTIWTFIAGTASVISIGHGILAVPGRIKEQEKLRRVFAGLRIDIETFHQRLTVGLNGDEAGKGYNKLRERFSECMSRTHAEIAFTLGLRRRIQADLDKIFKREGYIK